MKVLPVVRDSRVSFYLMRSIPFSSIFHCPLAWTKPHFNSFVHIQYWWWFRACVHEVIATQKSRSQEIDPMLLAHCSQRHNLNHCASRQIFNSCLWDTFPLVNKTAGVEVQHSTGYLKILISKTIKVSELCGEMFFFLFFLFLHPFGNNAARPHVRRPHFKWAVLQVEDIAPDSVLYHRHRVLSPSLWSVFSPFLCFCVLHHFNLFSQSSPCFSSHCFS